MKLRKEDVGRETQEQRDADSRAEVGEGLIEGVYLLLLCQPHLSPVNSLPVLRGCMTEINQRAIVHTLPLMRQPIDTGINRGMVREKCTERGKERGEKCRQKNGNRTIKKRKLEGK